jgi:hypothetical protein
MGARRLERSRSCFLCKKYGRKGGERRMARLKWLEEYCNKCGNQLGSWDARLSKALAYKYPCCESCIAAEYDMTATELRDRMEDYFGIRPCLGI